MLIKKEDTSTNFGAKMIHYDDEPILEQINSTEKEADLELDGYTEARIFSKTEATMVESQFKVLLELKVVGTGEERLGVDLVTVLDISESMKGTKLAKMKLAMQFLLQKLGPNDRLSVVTFNMKPDKLCPLRQITENSQTQIADMVNALVTGSRSNTEAGLKMALEILKHRTHTKGRRIAIMLMSDGGEDRNSHSANVSVGEVPVYTFGFGSDCDAEVLNVIANKSYGGMFAPVAELDDVTVAFSMSLAGLLNVVIEDLTLTITPENGSKFAGVNAGNYPQKKGSEVDPVTVTFPLLYDQETRKVLVTLTLPEVDEKRYKQLGTHLLKMDFKYRVGKDRFKSDVISIHVTRIATSNEAEKEEVVAEEKRIRTARSMKEAILLENAKKLELERKKLEDGKTSLAEVYGILTAQLDQLFEFMASKETYDNQGRAFQASHDSQRGGTRADMLNARLMNLHKQQTVLFDKVGINPGPDPTLIPSTS